MTVSRFSAPEEMGWSWEGRREWKMEERQGGEELGRVVRRGQGKRRKMELDENE